MNVREGPSDAEVVARVLGGDREAFGLIVRRYESGLLRFATRVLGGRDAAADAVAESLVRAYRHLARRATGDVSLEDAPPIADPADSEAALERVEQLAIVEQALATLSPEKREAFVLKHVEGMSYQEMAAVTGERIPTLKMRVHRAREALLKALEDRS